MTYAMFDDQTPDNPKIMEAGPLAGWLWFSAICWCNRHPKQNGVVTVGALRGLWSAYGTHQGRTAAIGALVRCGLFREADGRGYEINDWHIYQAEAVAKGQRRRKDRERKRIERANEAQQASTGQAPDRPPGKPSPVPVPVPVPVSPKGEIDARGKFKSRILGLAAARYEAKRQTQYNFSAEQQGAFDIATHVLRMDGDHEAHVIKALDNWFDCNEPWVVKLDWQLSTLAKQFNRWLAPPVIARKDEPDPEAINAKRLRDRQREQDRELHEKLAGHGDGASKPPLPLDAMLAGIGQKVGGV